MRTILARVCISVVAAAFILLCLVPFCHIPLVIPMVLFVIAIILFFVVKRMPADDEKKNMERAGEHNIEAAFFDNDEAATQDIPNIKTGRKDK